MAAWGLEPVFFGVMSGSAMAALRFGGQSVHNSDVKGNVVTGLAGFCILVIR